LVNYSNIFVLIKGFLISYLLPLGVILAVRFVEEILDEISRYKRDRKLNLEKYFIYDKEEKEFKEKLSQDVREGDIIKILNQRVPADIAILKSK
jgi:magnesium-transporting ATPase (P-type)